MSRFGDVFVVRGYRRYRVFCCRCHTPLAWSEPPDVRTKYYCDRHEGPPTPLQPPKAWAKGVKGEDNGNTFDDIVGLHEDGRD